MTPILFQFAARDFLPPQKVLLFRTHKVLVWAQVKGISKMCFLCVLGPGESSLTIFKEVWCVSV